MPFLTRARADAWNLLALPMLLFFLLPLAALFLRLSPASLIQVMRQPAAWQAVRVSLTTSLLSLAVTVILGLPLAWLLQRQRSRLSSLLELLVDLPTVLPPAAAGLALLMAFGRTGLVGSWLTPLGIQIPFTAAAVIMAQTFVSAPLFVRSATIGLAGVDRDLRQAAALDGAGSWQIFRLLMLPLARGALLSGASLAWARSLGEFGATILFAGNFPGRTQTMPLAIYLGFESDLNLALALSALLIGVSLLILGLVRFVLHSGWYSGESST